jgi:hypothetical protein
MVIRLWVTGQVGVNRSPIWNDRAKVLGSDLSPATKKILGDAMIHLARTHDTLLTLVPQIGQGFINQPLQPQSATGTQTPPPAQVDVTITAAGSFVSITPPSSIAPLTPQTAKALITNNSPNLAQAPMVHKLQSSLSPSFTAADNVQEYLASPQLTHFLPDTNPYWRVQSSYDGISFSSPSGVQAGS